MWGIYLTLPSLPLVAENTGENATFSSQTGVSPSPEFPAFHRKGPHKIHHNLTRVVWPPGLDAQKQIQDPITWRKIQAVAGELLEQTRLSASDIRDICLRVEESLR